MQAVTTFQQRMQRFPVVARLLKNASWLYVANLFGRGLGLLLTLFIASRFPPAAYGVIGLVVAYCGAVGRVIDFRIWEAVINYYGAYIERGESRKARQALGILYAIDLCSGVVAFVVVGLTAHWGARVFLDDTSLSPLILIYSLSLLVITVNGSSEAILRVHDRFAWLGAVTVISSFAKLVVFVALLSWLPWLEMVFFGYVISGAVTALLYNALAYGLVRQHTRPCRDDRAAAAPMQRDEVVGMVRFTVGMNIFGTLRYLTSHSDLLIMSFFAGNTVIGLYRLSTNLISVAMQFREPIQAVVYPDIVKAVASGDRARLRTLLRSATLLGGVLLGGICVAMLLLIHPVLALLLPDSAYLEAVPYIQIMLLGSLATFVFYWVRPLLVAHKRLTFLNLLQIVRFGVFVLAAGLLVPLLGDIGWAVVYGVGVSFWIGSQLLYVWRNHLLEPFARHEFARHEFAQHEGESS